MSTQHAHLARLRTRWSAVGAAVAITLGAGGLGMAQAAIDTGDRPVTVSITAERILDTRTNLGLAGRFADATPRDIQVTGSVPVASGGSKTVVPADAIGVVVNVTVVTPTHEGFLSLRPQGVAGEPTTSTVNFFPGAIEPNGATVDLNNGKIQIWVETSSDSGSADVLIDIVGYTIGHTHDDRYYTETEVDALIAAIPAEPRPARVIWVATSGGDYSKLSMALAAIGSSLPAASAAAPYLIKIAPGVYTETTSVALKDYVDIEGSGQDVTTLTCACGGTFPSPFVTAGAITAELRHVTVANTATGPNDVASAIYTTGVVDGSFSMDNVTAKSVGGDNIIGVFNSSSAPSMNHVTAIATGGSRFNTAVRNSSSSTTMNDVTAIASGGSTFNFGVSTEGGTTITIRNSTITDGIYNNGSTVNVAATSLGSAASVNGGVYACVGAHNSAFVALNSTCT